MIQRFLVSKSQKPKKWVRAFCWLTLEFRPAVKVVIFVDINFHGQPILRKFTVFSFTILDFCSKDGHLYRIPFIFVKINVLRKLPLNYICLVFGFFTLMDLKPALTFDLSAFKIQCRDTTVCRQTHWQHIPNINFWMLLKLLE